MTYINIDQAVVRIPHYPEHYIHRALEDADFFNSIVSSDDFKSAIYLVSPTLCRELEKYITNELSGKDRNRLKNTLLKYIARMSTRCTPFATLASCATAAIGERDDIVASPNIRTYFRPDMLYLCTLAQTLQKDINIKRNSRYKANSTLYKIGDNIRYISYQYLPNGRYYSIDQVRATPLLNYVLKQCSSYISFQELAQRIASEYKIQTEEIEQYIDTLIDNKIIIGDLEPVITGDDYYAYLHSKIKERGSTEVIKRMNVISDALKGISHASDTSRYKQCYNQITSVLKSYKIEINEKYLIQADSFREFAHSTISRQIVTQVNECMSFLNKITSKYENSNLTDFKKRFLDRYDAQEISLLEALDPDAGIGYIVTTSKVQNPLIDGLNLPPKAHRLRQLTLTPLTIILLRKLLEFNPKATNSIELTDDDVKDLKEDTSDLPLSMAAFLHVIGKNDDGSYQLSEIHFSGNSAANMLARFAHADNTIKAIVKKITQHEQASTHNAIIAEITHISESRTGNILSRPHIRNYEITYLTNSTLNDGSVIPVNDLLVSIRNQKIILRSKKLQKEIVPRLTTAHNFSNNTTPIYRFLCDLQSQATRSSLYFNWCGLESVYEQLPRVTYKNCILAPAKWQLAREQFMNKRHADMKEIKQWQHTKNLPREVNLIMGDNKLYINLDCESSVAMMLHEVAKSNRFSLEEYIPSNRYLGTVVKRIKLYNELIANVI